MNMYSGGLSTLTTVDTIKRLRPTLTARSLSIGFITVAAFVLALALPSNFLTNFNNFLLIVLYFMIPWTAVNLIDFFFVRHERYAIRELFKPRGLYGAWAWRGLTAYIIAFLAMIPFMSTTIWEGPVAKSLSGGDISPFVGFPIAAILYYLFSRDLDVAAEFRVADEQEPLLEAEALAHQEVGAGDEELLGEVGARVVDELEVVPEDGSITVERHPSA
jgi:nucleobase:cation symporter-1, NCS1 family